MGKNYFIKNIIYMNVNELLEKLQEKFSPEDLKGEFTIHGNCIIWEYNLDNDVEEIEAPEVDSDELEFDFESLSSEELLREAYVQDFELLEGFLDEIEELDNWTFSDPETIENIISFKIF
jgi:hypothetical protein